MPNNVLDFLERAVVLFPEKTVFADVNSSITYSELQKKVQLIGSELSCRFCKRKQPVVVFNRQDIDSLVLFLSVVYSGNCYVPIDPEQPEERLRLMLNTIQPYFALGTKDDQQLAERLGMAFVPFEELINCKADMEMPVQIRASSLSTDPLYMIFTSGSTGIPKAVVKNHASVIEMAECFKNTFAFDETDVFGNQSPFDFDVGAKSIYSTLCCGASMQIIPRELFSSPVKLIDYLNDRKVTRILWAATALCIVANLRAMKRKKPEYLRSVMYSGEVLPLKVLRYWKEHLPDVEFVNLYGPTEVAYNCTYYRIDRLFEDGESVPIGMPFSNVEIVVLDDNAQVVTQPDVQGELCVRGPCVALGYYNNPEKTNEVFVQDPRNTSFPSVIYRTGDIVKYNIEGQLVFCSRRDFQVKHMGHRIELGEIEVAAETIPQIVRACCLYDTRRSRIILVYQSDEKIDSVVAEALAGRLPRYMLPSVYFSLEQLPLNAHGKLDRTALKQQYAAN